MFLEVLDTTLSKSAGRYRNRKQNRRMSMFAYKKKMQDSIHSRAAKMGVAVFEVNPAFTSQIGKMKYMKQMHISIHQAASYVIGRRGMNLKEQVPKVLQAYTEYKDGKHHWKQWSVFDKKRSKRFVRTYSIMYRANLIHYSTKRFVTMG
ncbi:hypothetical protein GCM10020331_092660 [Ectobacillus funiculus]